MNKSQIKVYVQAVKCRHCGEQYSIAHEPKDEGFGCAPVLYECELTREIFFHSHSDPQYKQPVDERIIQINSAGQFKIRRTHPVHMKCPKCGNKDFDKFGKSEEQFVEAIPIYEME